MPILPWRANGQHDKIDLLDIDAKTTVAGNQPFHFIGNSSFHNKAGELNYKFDGPNTIVKADVDGDGTADFAITVNGHINFVEGDFVL